MNKIKLLIVIIFSIVLFYFIFDRFFSSQVLNGNLNIENAAKLKVGMYNKEVYSIMGKPDNIISLENKSFLLKYTSNNIDYMDIEITLDSNEKICSIFIP
jgi:hypothetical protein